MKSRKIITRDENKANGRYFVIHPNLIYRFQNNRMEYISLSSENPKWVLRDDLKLVHLLSYSEYSKSSISTFLKQEYLNA
jgi:hypothetical protein